MSEIEKELSNHLRSFDSAPFLFIGSGFSRRYINLESWEGLLRKFCDKLPKSFEYYSSSAEGNLPLAAQMMSNDFFDIWWERDEYKESREEFKNQIKGKSDPLKIEISKYMKTKEYSFGLNKILDDEINQLKQVVTDGIITTNWDFLLEQLFEDQISTTFVGQEELLFSNPKEISEIYKVHGCCSQPNSLVLTDNDYRDFKDKNAYLAAKLLTIFIEHPIIFIGYSMSDENIIEILRSITLCLSEKNLYKLKDRLIFIQRDTNNEGDSFQSTTMVIKNVSLNVTVIKTNDFKKIFKGMSTMKRKIPAKIYRQMKSQIYELVRTNDPNEQIYATVDIEDDVDPSEIEFVYGVGISNKLNAIGYTGISSNQLFEGIIRDIGKWDYNQIILEALPQALKTDGYIPAYKYFSLSSNLENVDLDRLVQKNLEITKENLLDRNQQDNLNFIQSKFSSISELETKYNDLNYLFDYIPLLKKENIESDYLLKVLKKYIHLLEEKNQTRTKLRKLIRFYDLHVYKEKCFKTK